MSAPTPRTLSPGSFEPVNHFYPRVLNAELHPVVRLFLKLGTERIVQRFTHLNPRVDAAALRELLSTPPRHFRWSGCDLMHVTDAEGVRRMVVIETNSCPSGQKSMPLIDDELEQGGYRRLLQAAFLPSIAGRRLPAGDLAVLWDKNPMEASGYAATLADLSGEPVHLVPAHVDSAEPAFAFDEGVLRVRTEDGRMRPVRAALRYVTQRPWTRIPPLSRTAILNPVLACLAGGRNKMVAAKAYDLYNAELEGAGLAVRTPETIWDVARNEVPLWVQRLGGHAVVKVPYSNAGQGVYTITGPQELDAFMATEQRYDRYIVQSLIGNYHWSSRGSQGQLFHVGTMPDRRNRSFVADLRVMICAGPEGFQPLAIYARRARAPLVEHLEQGADSWRVLGTNLSVKQADGSWDTESHRLMLVDRKDFNPLGISIDGLVEAYVQTVLATRAIDALCVRLTTTRRRFRRRLFANLNDDDALLAEIMRR